LWRWRVVDFDVGDGRASPGRFDVELQLDGLNRGKAQDALVANGCLPCDVLPPSPVPDFQRELLHALPERDALLRQKGVELDLTPEIQFERSRGHGVICRPISCRVTVNRFFGVEASVISADV